MPFGAATKNPVLYFIHFFGRDNPRTLMLLLVVIEGGAVICEERF
jgi:hypothetical protein